MGVFFPDYGGDIKLPQWRDPFPNGVHRKYWDMSYYTERPRSMEQMNDQSFLGAFFPPLTLWHQATEREEQFKHTMGLYGLKFEDIKYPYLTPLGSSSAAVGSATRGAIQVSRNITRLYS